MVTEHSPYRLLAEGSDDKHAIIHLMDRHGIDWDSPEDVVPYVDDCGGIDPLIETLAVAAKSGYKRLGVVVDANANIAARWDQVRCAFTKNIDIDLPSNPSGDGTIAAGATRDSKVGVWLMPDNQNRGQLEDFLSKLIEPEDACWDYARQVTQQAKELGARFPDKDACKANIHTWLAWQETPGLPFGTAITAKYFAADGPEALAFVNWFKRLFS
jgi:hypothetical protein